jgi:outer membrane cobalamin receptor
VTPRWTLAARLNNLGGRQYELVQGYNTPGSNLFVSLAYADL